MSTGKRGRPSKLTPELQAELCNMLRAGATIDAACEAAGVNRAQFYRWIAKAEEGARPYAQFRDEAKKALAVAEVGLVAVIREASKQQWQAAAWLLERRFKSRWARNAQAESLSRIMSGPPPVVGRRDDAE